MTITIIVPIYNVEKFLPRCLDSILRQTYENLEIILVNDGSTDSSGAICDGYAQKDARVKVIHQPNGGVSAARNAGIDAAAGEWLGFVDADDYIEPDMFEKLAAAAEYYGRKISVCGLAKYYADGRTEQKAPDLPPDIPAAAALIYMLDNKHYEGFLWNKLFHRSLFADARLDSELHYCEDLVLVTEIFLKIDGIAYIPDILYHYCMRADNAASTFNKKRLLELKARRRVIKLVKPVSKPALKKARYFYWRSMAGLARFGFRSLFPQKGNEKKEQKCF